MTNTPTTSLLRYLCQHPEDDSARLVYADHLDDEGENERAELIRVQLALTHDYDPAVADREAELLAQHGERWRQEVPAWARRGSHFRRGFVAEVRCTVVDWLKGGDDLVAQTPVEEVFFEPGTTDAVALAASAALTRVRSLILCNAGLGDLGVRDLLESPYLTNLRELFLAGNELSDSAAFWIANARNLEDLTELDLRDNHLGDFGIERLACSHHLRRLTTLYLVNNQIGNQGVGWLARGLFTLNYLYLNHNRIGNEGVRSLATSPRMAALTELDLRNNQITDPRQLAESPHLMNLRELLLRGNPLSNAGLFQLRQHFGSRLRL